MSCAIKIMTVATTAILNGWMMVWLVVGVFFRGGLKVGEGPFRYADQGSVLLFFIWIMLNLATCVIAARKGSDQ